MREPRQPGRSVKDDDLVQATLMARPEPGRTGNTPLHFDLEVGVEVVDPLLQSSAFVRSQEALKSDGEEVDLGLEAFLASGGFAGGLSLAMGCLSSRGFWGERADRVREVVARFVAGVRRGGVGGVVVIEADRGTRGSALRSAA